MAKHSHTRPRLLQHSKRGALKDTWQGEDGGRRTGTRTASHVMRFDALLGFRDARMFSVSHGRIWQLHQHISTLTWPVLERALRSMLPSELSWPW
eukprot:3631841-Amphidinium_carterae.1